MEGTTVWFQIAVWSILPIISTATFTILFFNVVLSTKPLNNLKRILLLFTGGALLWSFLELHISWISLTIPGESKVFEPSGLLENYTINIAFLAMLILGSLGIDKFFELIKKKEE